MHLHSQSAGNVFFGVVNWSASVFDDVDFFKICSCLNCNYGFVELKFSMFVFRRRMVACACADSLMKRNI